MRNKRFRPDDLDLASDGSVRKRQGIRLLLLGTAVLLAGLGFAAFSVQELNAARKVKSERQSRIDADQITARAKALQTNSRIEAAQAETRHIETLSSTGWLELLTSLEAAGKASKGRVVLLSLAPAEADAQAKAVRGTGIALTETDMLSYIEGFRHVTPAVSAELVSHQPEDGQDGDARRLVFLLRWTSPEEKTP